MSYKFLYFKVFMHLKLAILIRKLYIYEFSKMQYNKTIIRHQDLKTKSNPFLPFVMGEPNLQFRTGPLRI